MTGEESKTVQRLMQHASEIRKLGLHPWYIVPGDFMPNVTKIGDIQVIHTDVTTPMVGVMA